MPAPVAGVLAPAADWRGKIVPATLDGTMLPRARGRRRLDWVNLLRRVFLLEVLACACGGRRRVISSIEERPAAQKILRHLGLPHELIVDGDGGTVVLSADGRVQLATCDER